MLIGLVLAACASATSTTTHADDDAGIAITLPADWLVAPDSLTPVLGYPMLVAVSTFDAPIGGAVCAHVAANALDTMGADDVLLTIHELPFAAALGPRPVDFRGGAAFWENGDVLECMQSNPARIHGGQFRFFEGERAFDVVLAMRSDVSSADEEAAWAMLQSLTVLSR